MTQHTTPFVPFPRALHNCALMFALLAAGTGCSRQQPRSRAYQGDDASMMASFDPACSDAVTAAAGAVSSAGKRPLTYSRLPVLWGRSAPATRDLLGRFADKVDADRADLRAALNGGADALIVGLSGGKVVEFDERHTNTLHDRRFVQDYLAGALQRLGMPDSISGEPGRANWCEAAWSKSDARFTAHWTTRGETFSLTAHALARPPETLDPKVQMAVWDYEIGLEDKGVDNDQATAQTAAHFHVGQDDVFHVIVTGLDQHWRMPEQQGRCYEGRTCLR